MSSSPTKKVASPARQAFFTRLRSKFFEILAKDPIVGEWTATEIWQLANSIIQKHSPYINEYLDKEKIPVTEAERVINRIIRDRLLPELKNITL